MFDNICNFIPYNSDAYSIHTINYVLETKEFAPTPLKSFAMYRTHIIRSGNGILHTKDGDYSLNKGDVFFTFPNTAFSLEAISDFSCMYISFLGTRANMIMDKLKISEKNFLFPSCCALTPVWENGMVFTSGVSDLSAESVLLFTFAFLGNQILTDDYNEKKKDTLAYEVKKYIDMNFATPTLTLENISHKISYSPKYISAVFKKTFSVGVTDYLHIIRIQHACALIEDGFTSINDISIRCGYKDPLYFSKIFKKKTGQSPKAFIKNK